MNNYHHAFFRNAIKIIIVSAIVFVPVVNSATVIAHRGGSGYAMENSLAAVKKAIEIGVEYIEIDIHTSKDNIFFVMHDNSLSRTTNSSGSVSEMSYTQLKDVRLKEVNEPIPTLDELLTLAKNSINVCIEVKESNVNVKELLNTIKHHDMIDQTVISAFDYNVLKSVKKENSNQSVLLLDWSIDNSDIDKVVAIGGEYIGTGASISSSLLKYSQNNGVKVWVGTINVESAIVEQLNRGVDGVYSDFPDRALYAQSNEYPSNVSKITTKDLNGTVLLNWSPASFKDIPIKGYEIYRAIDLGTPQIIQRVANVASFIDENPVSNKTNTYSIKALNKNNNRSQRVDADVSIVPVITNDYPRLLNMYQKPDSVCIVFSEPVNRCLVNDSNVTYMNKTFTKAQTTICNNSSVFELSKEYSLAVKYSKTLSDTMAQLNATLVYRHLSELEYGFSHDSFEGPFLKDIISDHRDTVHTAITHLAGENAINFDGRSDYTALNNKKLSTFSGNRLSLSIQLRLNRLPAYLKSTWLPILNVGDNNRLFYLDQQSGGLVFNLKTNSNEVTLSIQSDMLEINGWHTYTAVYTGTEVILYMDGNEMVRGNLTGIVQFDKSLYLGKNGPTGTEFFNGAIGELLVYKDVLSSDDIQYLKKSSINHWPFNSKGKSIHKFKVSYDGVLMQYLGNMKSLFSDLDNDSLQFTSSSPSKNIELKFKDDKVFVHYPDSNGIDTVCAVATDTKGGYGEYCWEIDYVRSKELSSELPVSSLLIVQSSDSEILLEKPSSSQVLPLLSSNILIIPTPLTGSSNAIETQSITINIDTTVPDISPIDTPLNAVSSNSLGLLPSSFSSNDSLVASINPTYKRSLLNAILLLNTDSTLSQLKIDKSYFVFTLDGKFLKQMISSEIRRDKKILPTLIVLVPENKY
ncbi:MAG: glycerophosphodiester phosphodiesterase family protein [Fibrobacterales bacterium]